MDPYKFYLCQFRKVNALLLFGNNFTSYTSPLQLPVSVGQAKCCKDTYTVPNPCSSCRRLIAFLTMTVYRGMRRLLGKHL